MILLKAPNHKHSVVLHNGICSVYSKQQQQQNQTSQTGKAKCGMSIQWNIIQPEKERKNCHTLPHGQKQTLC